MELSQVRYDDPVVQELTREVLADYGRRYGGDGDSAPMDPEQFAPPRGTFILATLDSTPVGMGGWRRGGPAEGDAEIKRMYVRAQRRRSGIARRILDELERTARDAGVRRIVLTTGPAQPEAIAMYRAAGYAAIAGFGYYADTPGAIHLAKEI